MQVKSTYIITDKGGFKVLYHTFNGWWFITTHIVGQVLNITEDEATKLLKHEHILDQKG